VRIEALSIGALLWAASPAASQELDLPPVRYPALPAAAASADGLVPRGWAVVGRESGDLNGDGRPDAVLLMRMRDPANVVTMPWAGSSERFDTNPFLLAIAFREAGGGYRLAASNRGLFLRPSRPYTGEGPPGEDTIAIERGGLLVSFDYLRGRASYRFRWQSGVFRLIGYDGSGVSGGCIETISVNYLTRRARVTKGLTSSDRTRVAHRRLVGGAAPTLDRIDLETFSPDEAIAGPPLLCPPHPDE
jgi:hypothetical protein